MPFNGAGQFGLLFNWQTDAANGLNISSSRMQGQDADIAAALSFCMTKDGQQTAIANLPMGGFKFTNLGIGNISLTSTDSVNGTQIQTLNNQINTQIRAVYKVGEVKMWHGAVANIAATWGAGWQLADGTNGTANLKDQFIVGAGNLYVEGTTGGAASVTLTTSQLPPHSHPITDPGHFHNVTDPTHTHGGQVGGGAGTGYAVAQPSGLSIVSIPAAATGVTVNPASTGITTTNNTGTGASVPMLPPYYALCFIEFVGP